MRPALVALHVVAPHVSRRAALTLPLQALLLGSTLLSNPPANASPFPYAVMVKDASAAFEGADYIKSEKLWRKATEAYPEADLCWANLAVVLIINASDEMTLGTKPQGSARERLDEALVAIQTAERLGQADALLLNARGNAFGLLQQWTDAVDAYGAAVVLSARDFESIPASNQALALLELEETERAERVVRRIMRRDPGFVDALALLATIRWIQGDRGGTANAIATLCSGSNGGMWCERYSIDQVVLGRWTPLAVKAYRELLREPSIQLELRNGKMR